MLTSVLKSLPLFVLCLLSLAQAIEETKNIHCIKCVEGIDEGCGDPFDKHAYSDKYTKDCSDDANKPDTNDNEHREKFDYKKKDAVGCRKIQQEINDKIHIVRQCAYSGENVYKLKRTGNKGVKLWYYQCNDENDCNLATRLNSVSFTFLILSVFSSIVFFFNH